MAMRLSEPLIFRIISDFRDYKKNQQFKKVPLTFKNTDIIFAFLKTVCKTVLLYPA